MKIRALLILGALLACAPFLAPAAQARALPAPAGCGPETGAHGVVDASSWPSIDADASQSNYNPDETALTGKTVLRIKARWCALTATQSYPVVSAGRVYLPVLVHGKVHVRALDAATGKPLATYPKDALGGILASGTTLYLAGHVLQAVNTSSGQAFFSVSGSPRLALSTFVYPQTDGRYLYAGFYSGIHSSVYALDPGTGETVQKLPSTTASATISSGRVLTHTATASIFYDAGSGRALAQPPYLGSYWFAGSTLAYAVCSARGKGTSLIALDGGGHRVWSRSVGPLLATVNTDWPHAVGPKLIYVQTFRPQEGVEAVDALTGQVAWSRPLANIQRMALTRKLLVVLTYGLGQPGRLIALNPKSGKIIGGITLSPGFFPFGSANGLMVANGMIYIRVTGPNNVAELVALGL